MKAIVLGVFAAFFFAAAFIFNRSMELSGGSWIWSGSLRYFFMLPFLALLVIIRGNLLPLLRVMKLDWWRWILWSSVGFGLFYAPLCYAASFAPGWLIAGTWQFTIIAGSLLAPLFYETVQTTTGEMKVRGKIPIKGLFLSSIILIGIGLLQVEQMNSLSLRHALLAVGPVVVAAFAYPLGNRKMMDVCGGKLDTYQRVFGMTLASMPFWIILALYGIFTVGKPSQTQVVQSFIVAISSGVIATILFFYATDLVRGNMQKLATVEATQSMEVLFTVLGELVLLSAPLPSILSWTGMLIIMVGMILHSLLSQSDSKPVEKSEGV
ncbi:multidrug resistance efflux transporter family protein [Sporolactobacillus kofuensis]|uniref:Multidrug resistance efflux transporter family protein n=1 Tax=Sporolactobacillus kofuensis TaxID=269672 RepID=A0ABW1WD19_9BACL|nr:multidrug resistance efflux transporter family protein [Sporolactobacillus kofuensis]MCO7175659.1 multidrug resistance efflux transporter family protein [Sporolactobacillus kofuensis]